MTGTIYLGATEYSVGEREGFVTITIKRDGDASKAVSVSYATNPDNAAPGLDYTAISGNATIAAGASSTTVRIPILNDSLSETTERFNVSLINVDSGTLLFPRTTNISILDDENPVNEPPNPPQVSDYTIKRVDAVTGLDGPMQIEWIEDSNIALVSEKEGRIKIVNFDTGKVVSTLLDITGKVNSDADRGLLDIALHPDLDNNPYLYAYYVVDPADVKASGPASADNLGNRYAHLVRYELDMSGAVPTIKPGSETVMLGGAGKSLADISGGGALDHTDPIHSDKRASDVNADGTYKQDYIKVDSRSHAGGAIAFGPDGALYVSTGDGTSYNYADPRTASVQNTNSLSGKILRIDPLTGDGFADNPYATSNLDANASKVWQMGLRNPYAMTFTDDGRIMISETGWYSWEEINSGGKGANYGWPYFEGADNGEINRTPGYQTMPGASQFYANVANGTITITPAFRAFSHTTSDPGYEIQAIVGGTSVYDGDKYPEVFKGDYFFSDIVDGDIFTVDVNDRTQMQYVTNIGTYHAVSFVQGPDGYVYYSDITGNKIVRLDITDPNAVPNRAPVVANAIADATATSGTALSITIPANAFSDPDGDKLDLAASLSNGQALPGWLTFNAITRTFAGTPPAGQTAPIDIRVTAADPDGSTVNDVFRLTIGGTATNRAPVVAVPVADQTGSAGLNWNYKLPAGTFSDADNDALTLVATQANGQGLPAWVTFNAQTGNFTGTPPAGTTGVFTFRVTATDPKGAAASDDFTFTVGAATENVVNDVANQNQFVSGTTNNDVFRYAGASSLYQWGPSADGQSMVVWTRSATDDSFDVLTGFEKLRFSDKTISLVETVPAGPDYEDVADTIQELTGKTTADRFIINGKSTDYAWGNSADGKSLVIWTVSATDDTYDVLTAFDQLVFTDRTVYLTGTPPANAAPIVANPIADYVVPAAGAGMVFNYAIPAGSFTDANGDKLSYVATQANGSALPTWLQFDAATGVFRGQPPKFDSVSIKVTASDGKGGSVSDTFDITMKANNAPVVAVPVADQSFAPGKTFSIGLGPTFTDADNDPLLFSVTQGDGSALPSWISVTDNGRTLSGTVPANAGSLTIKVSASDRNGGGASDEFAFNVSGGNTAPTLVTPVLDQAAPTGALYQFRFPVGTFTDKEDGGALSYSVTLANGDPLPSWLRYSDMGRLLSGTPGAGDVGAVDLKVTARDTGGLTVSDIFRMNVTTGSNTPPVVANLIVDKVTAEDAAFSFTLPANTFTDANGDALAISAGTVGGNLPAWLKFDAATRTFSGTPANNDTGKVSILVTASDGKGGMINDTFEINVTQVNDAPTLANPIVDQAGTSGAEFSFALPSGTFVDVDNPTLTYAATLADGKALPSWLSFNAATGLFSAIPGDAQVGAINIKVTAKDPTGLTASDEFTLTIGAKPAGETLFQNTTASQNIDAGDGKDVFVLGASSTGYAWGPTQDGKGVVVWNDKGFDVLFNFEELRFTNKTVTVASILGTPGTSDVLDDIDSTQYLTGQGTADRFIIDGNAAEYGWGRTQDGKGVVVWDRSGDNPHDILTGFEKLVFDDREVDISGLV